MKKTEDDKLFFAEQMKGVKPLKSTATKINFTSRPTARKLKNFIESEPGEEFPLSDQILNVVTSETKLFFAQPGLQSKVLRSLRLGEIRQTQSLDLHGKTVDQARTALSRFLKECMDQQERCVRIIHGKGKPDAQAPVLKNHINSWLQQYPGILAFCSAIPRDGGTGAVYVMLKKK